MVSAAKANVSPLLPDSLIEVKGEPAVVSSIGKVKVEVLLTNGKSKKVKVADCRMVAPGPVRSWEIEELAVEVEASLSAVEEVHAYLAETGDRVSVHDLASTIFGESSFKTVWATWRLVLADRYFTGTPGEIAAHPKERVDAMLAGEAAAEKAEKERVAFCKRVKSKKLTKKDVERFVDVEDLALMRTNSSQILKDLEMTQSPDVALSLLLDMGLWTDRDDPWPVRCGIPADAPRAEGKVAVPEEEREDLRHLTSVAIDDADADDPDDAISCEADGTCWVHVADVAALVPPSSSVDFEARERCTSVYLPTGTVPMLPDAVTAAVGMGLGDTSPALSFGFRLTDDGELTDIRVVKSLVSVQRMSYAEASAKIEEGDELLERMEQAADAFRDTREAGGALGFNFPDVSVKVDAEGAVSIEEVPDLRSKDMVTEFMLMAGAAASRFALDNDIPFLYSSQEPPSQPAGGETPSAAPTTLSKMFQLLRSLSRSTIRTQPGFHSSLGMDAYSQVTSPLRRYGDLLLHQQLRAFLDDRDLLDDEELEAGVQAVEQKLGTLKKGERMSRQWFTLSWLRDQPADWQCEAVCLGYWAPKPNAPRIAQVLIPSLGLMSNVRLRADVRKDERMRLKLKQVRLVDMRADWTHMADQQKLYGTEEADEYKKLWRARKNVGTRMHTQTKRQG